MTNEIILKFTKGVNQPLTYEIDGDHTNRNVYFTIKPKTLLETDDRLLDKLITDKTFADGKTTLEFTLLPSETQDLPNFVYCAITSTSKTDINDVEEPLNGYINLLPNVRTPSDGIPEVIKQGVLFEANNATVGDVFTCKIVNGVKTWVNETENDLKTRLGIVSGSESIPVRLSNITLPAYVSGGSGVSSWLRQNGKYVYTYTNSSIKTTSDVTVIPATGSLDTVFQYGVFPTITVSSGSAKFYALHQPNKDIKVDIIISEVK